MHIENNKIVLASANEGKVKELQVLLSSLSLEVVSQNELKIESCEETGTTFIENAIQKARHVSNLAGMPALADDSGLAVDALKGEPGVYSARYAGPDANDADRIQKVLDNLGDTPWENRTAKFHCVLALIRHEKDPTPIVCHGFWEGYILSEPRGEKGFGYDPIFYDPTHDASAAELEPALKNTISHRARAFAQLLKFLKEPAL